MGPPMPIHIHLLALTTALAWGSGAILNKKGFYVDGMDISKKSLEKAKLNENKKLKFYLKDMRKLDVENKYNFVLKKDGLCGGKGVSVYNSNNYLNGLEFCKENLVNNNRKFFEELKEADEFK